MKPFSPHPLLRGGQLQTLAGQLMPKPPPPAPYETMSVALEDGDRILLHVNLPERDAGGPVVVLLHGLGGCSESTYVLRITAKLNALGMPAARFNHRGCGKGGEGLARGIYHAGRAPDVHAALAAVAARFPGRKVLPAAFSLSANMLLKLLGDRTAMAALPSVSAAMAVCPPVDLELCSQALDARVNWHIDRYYTQRMLAEAHAKHANFPGDPAPQFPRRMTLRLFDEMYTAPRGGFKNRDHYYDGSSARHVAHAIERQTLVLAAADDPIIPVESFLRTTFSSAVELRLETDGGHMGFIAKHPTAYGDLRWMDEAVVDWAIASI